VLIGDRGNDTIRARNGKRDIIRGGPGRDKAYVDKVDKVTGVEKEVVPGSGGGPGGPQPKKQCADGKDNDGDGKIDRQDPGCASAADNTESPDPPPKQCADGKDNDNDGKIDFGTGASNDPGCESATDNTENTPPDAKNDDLPTTENNSESIDVLSNDTDDDGDTLTVTNVTDPRHGTVTRSTPSDNTPSYRPDDCYDGRDSFDYIVSDGHGGTDKGTVNVTVDPDPMECPPPGPGPAVPAANWTSDHPMRPHTNVRLA
jgi:hypothetical protein